MRRVRAGIREGRRRGRGVPRIAGVPVCVRPTWLLAAAVVTIAFGPVVGRVAPGIGTARWGVSAAYAVLLTVSVLAHELGHTAVALRAGLPVRRIEVGALHGGSVLEALPRTPGVEAAVALGGPLASFAVAAVAAPVALLAPDRSALAALGWLVALTNLLLGTLNLLPGLPLDGGHVVLALGWRHTGVRSGGLRVAVRAGRLAGLLALVTAVAAALLVGPWLTAVAMLAAVLLLGGAVRA